MNVEQQQAAVRRGASELLESEIAILEELLSQALAIARRELAAAETAVSLPH